MSKEFLTVNPAAANAVATPGHHRSMPDVSVANFTRSTPTDQKPSFRHSFNTTKNCSDLAVGNVMLPAISVPSSLEDSDTASPIVAHSGLKAPLASDDCLSPDSEDGEDYSSDSDEVPENIVQCIPDDIMFDPCISGSNISTNKTIQDSPPGGIPSQLEAAAAGCENDISVCREADEPVKPPRSKKSMKITERLLKSPVLPGDGVENVPSESSGSADTGAAAASAPVVPTKPKPVPKPRARPPVVSVTPADSTGKMTRSSSYEKALEDNSVIMATAGKDDIGLESQAGCLPHSPERRHSDSSRHSHTFGSVAEDNVTKIEAPPAHLQPSRPAPPPPKPKPKVPRHVIDNFMNADVDMLKHGGNGSTARSRTASDTALPAMNSTDEVDGRTKYQIQKAHPMANDQIISSAHSASALRSQSNVSAAAAKRISSGFRTARKDLETKTNSVFYYSSDVSDQQTPVVSARSIPVALDRVSRGESAAGPLPGSRPNKVIPPPRPSKAPNLKPASNSSSDITHVESTSMVRPESSTSLGGKELEGTDGRVTVEPATESITTGPTLSGGRSSSPGFGILAALSGNDPLLSKNDSRLSSSDVNSSSGNGTSGSSSAEISRHGSRSSADGNVHNGLLVQRNSSSASSQFLCPATPAFAGRTSDLLSPISPAEFSFELADEESKLKEIAKLNRKAYLVAKEIVESEESFISVLRLLNEDFINYVKSSTDSLGRPVLPDELDGPAIRYLPQLQKLNEDLLSDLKARLNNWETDPRLGDVFVKKGAFLKMYTGYISEYESLVAALDDLRRRYPEFDRVTSDFENGPLCAKLAIRHYMLKPIQRIPQYRLLLRDYLKHLMSDSPDYENTKAALEIVSQVAEHANQTMKYFETVKRLREIQTAFGEQFEVIKPGRILVKEGILNKLSRKEMQPRTFFLFNDILLYATSTSTGYKLNNAMPISGMQVSLPKKEDFQNEFSIITTQRSFTISARTDEERVEWLKALEETIRDSDQRRFSYSKGMFIQTPGLAVEVDLHEFKVGSRAPVWIPDDRVSMCMLCKEEFRLAFRRHHCRGCGKVVCHTCSDYKAPLDYLDFKPERVCEECFDTLWKAVEAIDETVQRRRKDSVTGQLKSRPGKQELKSLFRGYSQSNRGARNKAKPAVLDEVRATDENNTISGHLKIYRNKKWVKMWFVVKGKVLYTFKACQDAAAEDSLPLLGYEVCPCSSQFYGSERNVIFELRHSGLATTYFRTEDQSSCDRWITAMRLATIP